MAENFFKFQIPSNADGSRITYSRGWCGTVSHSPSDVTVLIYNDAEGWGIAKTPDAITQPEYEQVTRAYALQQVDYFKARDLPNVYVGAQIEKRWSEVVVSMLALPPVDLANIAECKRRRQVRRAEELAEKEQEARLNAPVVEEQEVNEAQEGEVFIPVARERMVFCGKCHRFVTWLPKNLRAAKITMTCPVGHKVVLNGK